MMGKPERKPVSKGILSGDWDRMTMMAHRTTQKRAKERETGRVDEEGRLYWFTGPEETR